MRRAIHGPVSGARGLSRKSSRGRFSDLVRDGLKLEVGQSKTVDFELQIGQTNQSVRSAAMRDKSTHGRERQYGD